MNLNLSLDSIDLNEIHVVEMLFPIHILQCCRGKMKSAYGYTWKFFTVTRPSAADDEVTEGSATAAVEATAAGLEGVGSAADGRGGLEYHRAIVCIDALNDQAQGAFASVLDACDHLKTLGHLNADPDVLIHCCMRRLEYGYGFRWAFVTDATFPLPEDVEKKGNSIVQMLRLARYSQPLHAVKETNNDAYVHASAGEGSILGVSGKRAVEVNEEGEEVASSTAQQSEATTDGDLDSQASPRETLASTVAAAARGPKRTRLADPDRPLESGAGVTVAVSTKSIKSSTAKDETKTAEEAEGELGSVDSNKNIEEEDDDDDGDEDDDDDDDRDEGGDRGSSRRLGGDDMDDNNDDEQVLGRYEHFDIDLDDWPDLKDVGLVGGAGGALAFKAARPIVCLRITDGMMLL